MYFLFLIQFILVVVALFLLYKTFIYTKKVLLIKKIEKMKFPAGYESILQNIPHFACLPDILKQKIRKSILFFIKTKEFRGIEIDIDDRIKVVIAFYACLLKISKDDCYENLRTIIVYPNEIFKSIVSNNAGISTREDVILEGESIGGSVVIVWNEAKKEAYHPKGNNVIVHEFTHEIDFEDGEIDGIPAMDFSKYRQWTDVMFKEYDKLKEIIQKGRYLQKYKFIGSYAAKNEAEFFAVTSELFFEKPLGLKKHFPDIYNELRDFYGFDSAEVFGGV